MSYFWGARFKTTPSEDMIDFTVSEDIELDSKLVLYDILGTEAHDIMLWEIKLLSKDEIKKILTALETIKKDVLNGKFELKKEYEDVHLNLEKEVTKKIGKEIGGKIHLARSRNDQILVDLRMYMRDSVINIMEKLVELMEVLADISTDNTETLLPGYTHLQHAQPITFSHWCLSHIDALIRDFERLYETYKRINMNPLGAGAIAGFK
ncbi:MAG: lyase family protein, partial [Candidatus Odinarchaeia archaeon]